MQSWRSARNKTAASNYIPTHTRWVVVSKSKQKTSINYDINNRLSVVYSNSIKADKEKHGFVNPLKASCYNTQPHITFETCCITPLLIGATIGRRSLV